MDLLKMYSLLKMGIFHCHISLPECNNYGIPFHHCISFISRQVSSIDTMKKTMYNFFKKNPPKNPRHPQMRGGKKQKTLYIFLSLVHHEPPELKWSTFEGACGVWAASITINPAFFHIQFISEPLLRGTVDSASFFGVMGILSGQFTHKIRKKNRCLRAIYLTKQPGTQASQWKSNRPNRWATAYR